MSKYDEQIDELIKTNKVFVASKSYCPFCLRTKATLKKRKVDVNYIELDLRLIQGYKLQKALEKKSGQQTVPNIWINGKHIGGNHELQQLKKNGELDRLLGEEYIV